MKMKKRFLSILLSLVMVLGLMPGMGMTVFAESKEYTSLTVGDVIKLGDRLNITTANNGNNYVLIPTDSSTNVYKLDVSKMPWTLVRANLGNEGHSFVKNDNGDYYAFMNKDGNMMPWVSDKTIMVSSNSDGIYFKEEKYNCPGVEVHIPHTHSFTYTASGDTITATCGNTTDCPLADSKAILTIGAPTLTTYGGTGSAAATLTGLDAFKTATSLNVDATNIKYAGKSDTTYAESATAPTNAGKYTAKITLSGVKTGAGDNQSVTASVDYEIAKAATTVTTAPTAGEITYGKTLADSTLTGGTASAAGTFAWKDTTIVPAVSDSQKTEYDVVFTPTDGNYATAECKVKLTVIKADASRDVPEKALPYTGQPQELVTAGTVSGGTLQYALGTDANTAPTDGWSTEIPTGTEPGTYYVWYRVLGDENHNDVAPACVVVTITPAAVATPTANSDSDYNLLASMKTSGDRAFKLKWTAVTGAEGYDVFLGDCGGGECELKKTVTGLSCKIGKLKKGNAYKAFVKAWKTENGQKVYIGEASPDVHAVAGGKSNKYTNAKKITVKKKKLTVAVGASKKIKASLKKFSNSRRYLNHTAKIRYFSSDHTVATVNAKGKVTGVAPGTCTVYAVAENGLRKGVKITVK